MTLPDSLAVGDLWESEAKVVVNHPSITSILFTPTSSPYTPETVTGTPGQAEAWVSQTNTGNTSRGILGFNSSQFFWVGVVLELTL